MSQHRRAGGIRAVQRQGVVQHAHGGKRPDRDLTALEIPLAHKALRKLRDKDFPKKDTFHVYWNRVCYDGKKTLEKESKKYLAKISPLFVDFFSKLENSLKGRSFEILIVGPGSNLPGLRRALNDAAPSPADVKTLGDRNAAKDWVELFLAMETLSRQASDKEKKYHKTYRLALKGNSEDQYKLAKMYAGAKEAFVLMKKRFIG